MVEVATLVAEVTIGWLFRVRASIAVVVGSRLSLLGAFPVDRSDDRWRPALLTSNRPLLLSHNNEAPGTPIDPGKRHPATKVAFHPHLKRVNVSPTVIGP